MRRGGSEFGPSVEEARSKDVGVEVSAEGGEAMKSSKEGPRLRRSRKVVVGLRGGVGASGTSVANGREKGCRIIGAGEVCDENRQRRRGAFDAIFPAVQSLYEVEENCGKAVGIWIRIQLRRQSELQDPPQPSATSA